MGRRSSRAQDRDFANLHWTFRTIVFISWRVRNSLHQLHACLITLPEDGIAAVLRNSAVSALAAAFIEARVQVWLRDLSDKKLRSTRVGAAIGIGKPARLIVKQIRPKLVFNRKPDFTRDGSCRIAALDHEFGNYAMKDRAVVKWNAVHLGSGRGVGPVLRAFRQADEVCHPDWSFVRKQSAGQFSSRSINDRGRRTRCCCRLSRCGTCRGVRLSH